MNKIVSRSNTKSNLIDVSLSAHEIMLIMSLLHTASVRTYGNSYSFYAHTLTEKLQDISGITTTIAANLVDPAINIYDEHGNYLTTYHIKDYRIVFK